MIKTAKRASVKPFISNFPFIFLQGVIIGTITRLVVGTLRWIIDHTIKLLFFIYPLMRQKPIYLVPYIIATLLIVLILGKIVEPVLSNITGPGVSQVGAVTLNENKVNWWSILWHKFASGLLVICSGLFLGREGPCTQVGTMVGQAFGENLFRADPDDLKRLQGYGIATGLSTVFSVPLAGVFFLVEEITSNLTPEEVLTALVTAMSPSLMMLCFFDTQPCLYLPLDKSLPPTSYWLVTIIGVVLDLPTYLYRYCLLNLKLVYTKITKIPAIYHSVIPLLFVVPIGLQNADLFGDSCDFTSGLFDPTFMGSIQTKALSLILLPPVWFAVRFTFSMVSCGASVPGGISMPILVLGTLLGVIFAVLMIHFNIAPKRCHGIVTAASMCSYLGTIGKAPLTALTLLTEMVGSVEQISLMLITTFAVYFVLDLLGGKPVYTAPRIQMSYHKLFNLLKVKHAEE